MSKGNQEIEFRFKIKEKEKLLKWLNDNARFLYEKKQIDEYFTPQHKNFLKEKYPYRWLRIRKSGNKSLITYKHFYPEGAKEHTHGDEYEFGIDNAELMRTIFMRLDFESLVIVHKSRRAYKYKNCEITVDDIKGLGVFSDIEILDGYDSIQQAHKILWEIAEEIGLSKKDQTEDMHYGYAYLMAKKEGII